MEFATFMVQLPRGGVCRADVRVGLSRIRAVAYFIAFKEGAYIFRGRGDSAIFPWARSVGRNLKNRFLQPMISAQVGSEFPLLIDNPII